jgi:hypothetical protein
MVRENKTNTILNQYLREKRKEGFYCYYELKVVKGHSFQFLKIEEGQHEGLPPLEKEGMVWKLSDEDRRRKPCDGFSTPPLPSYLVMKFDDALYFVRYFHIEKMRNEGKVSISMKTAKEIADKVIHI